MLRAAGIVALFVLASACASSSSSARSTPPSTPSGNWVLDLTFSGDISGHMSAIVANSGDNVNECTGTKSHSGDPWSDAFYGTVDTGTQVYGVTFLVSNYRGAGTYKDGDVSVQVHNPDDSQAVWQNISGDKATLVINKNLQSGTIDAQLTDANSGKQSLNLKGSWNCRG